MVSEVNNSKKTSNISKSAPKSQTFSIKNKYTISSIIVVVVIVIIGIVIGIILINKAKREEEYNNLPIKVNISMTSYYGNIDYILYELGLDFDLVTMGANCYSGVQKNEFKTIEYGLLHTEFRYCKSSSTQIFRVYNDEEDQPLREPKYGELSEFDKYGDKIYGNDL